MKIKAVDSLPMSVEHYEETQKMPERVEGAEKGKAWTAEFMAFCKMRHDVEQPGKSEEWDENLLYRTSNCLHLFWKYMVEIECDLETGKNSTVCCIANTSDGQPLVWHNLVGSARAVYKDLYQLFLYWTRTLRKTLADLKDDHD